MNSFFFSRLAADNIRKNKMTYLPYLLTCILTVSMFYIVMSLSQNPELAEISNILTVIMTFGNVVIAVFSLIFLFYTHSFLIKRRKKEFAVFHILGMEKRHLTRTFTWETVYVACISLFFGIVFGMALDKAMFLFLTKILDANASLGFFLSGRAVLITIALFFIIFFLILIRSVFQLKTASPIDLLQEGKAGEKEPKTKWILAVSGFFCTGAGYYISITTEDPISSIPMFFAAVFLVILGTYLLFTAGSIALLKILRKNKRYYYKTNHFTSISGLIYRMRQNAAGLSNICILSTMVLVMVSSTSSLMIGMEDMIMTRYPNEFSIYSHSGKQENDSIQKSFDEVRRLQKEWNLNITKETEYAYLPLTAVRNGIDFNVSDFNSDASTRSIAILALVPLSDYNRCMGTSQTLNRGEALLYASRSGFSGSKLRLSDQTYRIKEHLDEFMGNGELDSNIFDSLYLVVPDDTALFQTESKSVTYYYGFDANTSEEEARRLNDVMRNQFSQKNWSIESRQAARTNFIALYGGLFFIGIFLGILFTVATVLIIYYKQISEGFDDKERYEIMQKVGMSRSEVRHSIHSQVLTVFFLPLIVAGIHVTAAFPLIRRMLALFSLTNTLLYITCTGICFLAFAAMYMAIYFLTAKTYYKIVRM